MSRQWLQLLLGAMLFVQADSQCTFAAQTPTAQDFTLPTSVAGDAFQLRWMVADVGAIHTVTPDGSGGYDIAEFFALRQALSATALAVAADDGTLYVVEDLAGSDNSILVFDTNGTALTSPFATFTTKVSGILLDSDTIYLVEEDDSRVVKYNRTTGAVILAWGEAGSSQGQFFKPVAIAQDGSGTIFVLDRGNFRVQAFTTEGAFLFEFGSFELLEVAAGISASNDVVFVSDGRAGVIAFSAVDGAVFPDMALDAGSGPAQFSQPMGIASTQVPTDPSMDIYLAAVADFGNNRVSFVELTCIGTTGTTTATTSGTTTGTTTGTSTGTTTGSTTMSTTPTTPMEERSLPNRTCSLVGATLQNLTGTPLAVEVFADDLYYIDSDSSAIRLQDMSLGTNTEYISRFGVSERLVSPIDLAFTAAGVLYVLDGERVAVFNQLRQPLGIFAEVELTGTSPGAITALAQGGFFVSTAAGTVLVFDGAGSLLRTWPLTFQRASGMATDPNGFIFVLDRNAFTVSKVSQAGTLSTSFGSFGTGDAQFIAPEGITCDVDGNVYVVDRRTNSVHKFDNNGRFLLRFPRDFNSPDVAVTSLLNVVVVDTSNEDQGEAVTFLQECGLTTPSTTGTTSGT